MSPPLITAAPASEAATISSQPGALPPEQWFKQEVHPHDGQLKAYLRGQFPSVRDVDDVVQESYLRIWKAKATTQILSARAFLFTVARRLALDVVRKDKRHPLESIGEIEQLTVLQEGPVDPTVAALRLEAKIDLLAQAIAALPARRREILILRKFDLVPQREVAERLGVSERTVEHTLRKALDQCTAFFHARGVRDYFSDVP